MIKWKFIINFPDFWNWVSWEFSEEGGKGGLSGRPDFWNWVWWEFSGGGEGGALGETRTNWRKKKEVIIIHISIVENVLMLCDSIFKPTKSSQLPYKGKSEKCSDKYIYIGSLYFRIISPHSYPHMGGSIYNVPIIAKCRMARPCSSPWVRSARQTFGNSLSTLPQNAVAG